MNVTNVARAARLGAAFVIPACALAPNAAVAATASSSIGVSATVSAACTVSTSSVGFGTVDTTSGSNVDAAGSISVTCTNGTTWSAAAGAGGGSGATMANRKMTSGANTLGYTLYTDSGRSTVWGDGTLSTGLLTGTGTGTSQSASVYGRIFANQTGVPAGSYADTVSVTVTY
jgi:spore coat protein U-like protein